MTPLVSSVQLSPPSSTPSSLVPTLTAPTAPLTPAQIAAMYAPPPGSYPDQPYTISALGGEQPPFYNTAATSLELKESLAGSHIPPGWPYTSVYYPYEASTLASYSFGGYGMGLDAARRKNATREATTTLKSWLNEHKKNPYPTKGEKIMLAIITKMSLTQVSTWFANARRRLKKENKMTWEPRSRTDDDEDDDDDRDDDKLDEKDRKLERVLYSDSEKDRKDSDDISVTDDITDRDEAEISLPPTDVVHTKPRIWSLADLATSGTLSSSGSSTPLTNTVGKITAGGLARGLHQLEAAPYSRPIFSSAAYPYIPSNVSESLLSYSYAKPFQFPPMFDAMSHGLLTSPLVHELSRQELGRAELLRSEHFRLHDPRLDKEA